MRSRAGQHTDVVKNQLFKRHARGHKFGIQLYWIVAELGDSHCFQALTALRQVRVSLDPSEAVHVDALPALVLVLSVFGETDLLQHVNAVQDGSGLNEGEVERVAVVRGNNGRLGFSDVLKEASNRRRLVLLIEDGEWAFVLCFGRVFEVLDVFANDLAIRDEIAL